MVEPVKDCCNYKYIEEAIQPKTSDELSLIAYKALQYFTEENGNMRFGKQVRACFCVSELTRDERVRLREKIQAIKPEWNFIISKHVKDFFEVPVWLERASPLQALEPGRDFWEKISKDLENNMRDGKAFCDVTDLDYDKQIELLGWLKEKRPKWQATIEERNHRDGCSFTKFFPGEMSDILTVTVKK